jgi:STAS-like domain of unknown function (DUF4325)
MEGCNQRTKIIRKFILDNVSFHPNDIVKVVAQKFAISRQAAARHLKKLTTQGDIEIEGNTSGRIYRPSKGRIIENTYAVADMPKTELVWKKDILPLLQSLPDNVLGLWKYCFTEIFSNGIDHSDGKTLNVQIIQQKSQTTINIKDDGIGIFRSIKEKRKLSDDEDAALKLSKSRIPIKSNGHVRANILLSSRMTDHFTVISKRVVLTHQDGIDWDWTLDRSDDEIPGTLICMIINNDTEKTFEQTIRKCKASAKDASAKTCIPVRLMDYSAEALYSRSQARRVLDRVDRFKVAILDFFGVKKIGPAFADQIFRVFSSKHPDIRLLYTNANKQVEAVIQEAKDYLTETA